MCRAHYAGVLTWGGEWAHAERILLDVQPALASSRPPWAPEASGRLGDLRRRQGRFDEAERLFAEAEPHLLAALEPVFEYLGPLLPRFAVAADGPELHRAGVLEAMLAEAGLATREAGHLQIPEEYPDLDTLLRAWLSIGPVRMAVRNAGEAAVREALTTAFAPLRTSNGGYRVEDEYRYVIARR